MTLLIAPGLAAALAVSCDDKDESYINNTGGTGGQGGTAGTGGGGSGGNGGSGISGAAGNSTGGTAGSGAGGVGGSGGSAGTGGSAGAAGSASLLDGGVDGGGDEPDSSGPPPVLTAHQQTAATICALEDQVASCQASASGCRDALVAQWEGFQAAAAPTCAATIDAYFNCVATEPVTSYDCNGDNSTPQVTVPNPGACTDQENAFFGTFDPTNTCQ